MEKILEILKEIRPDVDFLKEKGPTLLQDIHLEGVSDRKIASVVQDLLEREVLECQKFSPTLTLKQPVRM